MCKEIHKSSQVATVIKSLAANGGDRGSIPGSGRPPGEGYSNSLQYSCLENPMDRGAWWTTVHEVTKSWIWLSDWTRKKILAAKIPSLSFLSLLWSFLALWPLQGSFYHILNNFLAQYSLLGKAMVGSVLPTATSGIIWKWLAPKWEASWLWVTCNQSHFQTCQEFQIS